MPYDANLVLRGAVSGTYTNLVNGDSAATTIAQNGDGNYVVDLGVHGTVALGLDCIIVLHDQPTAYTNYADFIIQDSDHLSDGWQSLLTFPTIYAYMIEIVVVAITAFVATDIGLVLDGGGSGDSGIIREFSRKLLAVGGTGKMFIEMQASGDLYDTTNDTVDANSGTGDGTQIGIGRAVQSPLTLVRRFSTPKRYVRLAGAAPDGGDFGDVDILITGSQHNHVNNLYR